MPNNPFIVNRYVPLSKVQEEEHQITCNKRNSYLSSSWNHYAKHKPKVIFLGDNHIRGCSEKLSNLLGNSFSVIGYTKTNANVNDIVNSTVLKSEQLSKKRHSYILWGNERHC